MKRKSRSIRNIRSSSSVSANSLTSSTSLTSPTSSPNLGRCQFFSTDNRRCRNPRWEAHPALCLYHARRERLILDAERVAAELAPVSGEFKTSTDVNLVLGRLFSALAHNRIPPGTAATLAYIGGLLLNTLPRVSQEVANAYGFQAWDRKLRQLFDDGAAALIPQSETREPTSQA